MFQGFIWSETLPPSGPVSQVRICWAPKAWKWQKRQFCWLESSRSLWRGACWTDRWTDWSDRPSKNREFPQVRGRGSAPCTVMDVWRRTAAPASGRDETASGNCRGSAAGWRKGRRSESNLLRCLGGSSTAEAGGMGKGRAGCPWPRRGSSCTCKRPGPQGEATSWPDADACPSSCGSGTTPGTETQRVKY